MDTGFAPRVDTRGAYAPPVDGLSTSDIEQIEVWTRTIVTITLVVGAILSIVTQQYGSAIIFAFSFIAILPSLHKLNAQGGQTPRPEDPSGLSAIAADLRSVLDLVVKGTPTVSEGKAMEEITKLVMQVKKAVQGVGASVNETRGSIGTELTEYKASHDRATATTEEVLRVLTPLVKQIRTLNEWLSGVAEIPLRAERVFDEHRERLHELFEAFATKLQENGRLIQKDSVAVLAMVDDFKKFLDSDKIFLSSRTKEVQQVLKKVIDTIQEGRDRDVAASLPSGQLVRDPKEAFEEFMGKIQSLIAQEIEDSEGKVLAAISERRKEDSDVLAKLDWLIKNSGSEAFDFSKEMHDSESDAKIKELQKRIDTYYTYALQLKKYIEEHNAEWQKNAVIFDRLLSKAEAIYRLANKLRELGVNPEEVIGKEYSVMLEKGGANSCHIEAGRLPPSKGLEPFLRFFFTETRGEGFSMPEADRLVEVSRSLTKIKAIRLLADALSDAGVDPASIIKRELLEEEPRSCEHLISEEDFHIIQALLNTKKESKPAASKAAASSSRSRLQVKIPQD